MIARFLEVLHNIDLAVTEQDIADLLWLATYISDSSDEKSLSRESQQSQIEPSNILAEKFIKQRSQTRLPHTTPLEEAQSLASAEEPEQQVKEIPDTLHLPIPRSDHMGDEAARGMALSLPTATALPKSSDIIRALRPFKRRIASRTKTIIDEGATARQIAEQNIWIPVMVPERERWLDIALVVDESASMVIWQQTIAELYKLLTRMGAFRDVRLWSLVTDNDSDVSLYLSSPFSKGHRQTRSPGELLDPEGRRLILLVSDCVSLGWRNGKVPQILAHWGQNNPVSLIQVLPQRLWSRTFLGFTDQVQTRVPFPAAPNKYLKLIARPGLAIKENQYPLLSLPIVTLEPAAISFWTKGLLDIEGGLLPGRLLMIKGLTQDIPYLEANDLIDRNQPIQITPLEYVRQFKSVASPTAFKLAQLLAATPITLSIARIVQRTLLPESQQSHLAEVLLSGLLEQINRVEEVNRSSDMQYDFIKGVRDVFLDSLPISVSAKVLKEISIYLQNHLGSSFDFPAILQGSSAINDMIIDKNSRPFAIVAIKILNRIGKKHITATQLLEERLKNESAKEERQRSSEQDQLLFHERLRHERLKRSWSQERLAEEAGVGLRTIQRWENGRAIPRFAQQERLSIVLGMTLEELGLDLHTPHVASAEPNQETVRPSNVPEPTTLHYSSDIIPFHQRLRLERFKRSWSQEKLAEEVGVDLRTIRRWERGLTPRFALQKRLGTVLGMTPEELGLDLHAPRSVASVPLVPTEQTPVSGLLTKTSEQEVQEPIPTRLHEAPAVPPLAGRKQELADLKNWIVVDRCKLVAILGIGGVGKTVLVATLAEKILGSFSTIFWCSLRNTPPLEQILPQCIQVISGRVYATLSQEIEEQIELLLHLLYEKRCLLIFDNMESIMQTGRHTGFFKAEYESYGILIHRIGERKHQSCLVVTSREKPDEVALLEGPHASVRVLDLLGVDMEAGRELMQDKEITGSEQEWEELIERYSGNPLALRLVAEPIRELFGGSIKHFLSNERMLFRSLNHLLEQQLGRLSAQEYALLCWLAIEREPVSAERLRENLVFSVPMDAVLEGLKLLRQRSMIERYSASTFTLQPVIMEYMTNELIEHFVKGFATGVGEPWSDYALMKAQVPEYVRESQEHFLLAPVAQWLLERQNKSELLQSFQQALSMERRLRPQQSNYLAANVLHVLGFIGADLRGLDCSDLVIWQANLQTVLLSHTNFAHATFIGSNFINMLGNVLAVAFSAEGKLLAIGTTSNEIWMYESKSGTVLFTYQGHMGAVWSVLFNDDGKLLASGSDDGTIRLWDTRTGLCLGVLMGHNAGIKAVAFSLDGKWLASGGNDCTARIWSAKSGKCLQVLEGHTSRIWSVAFSPDGRMLATGSTDRSVRLWDLTTGVCLSVLIGHESWVLAVAFSPDGKWLASGGDDGTIRLWNLAALDDVRVLEGHAGRVRSLSFHQDRRRLASGSEDRTIRIWDVQTGEVIWVLNGHQHGVRAVAFDLRPSSNILASGGDDQMTRIWDVESGYCLKILRGYTNNRIWVVAFSLDGRTLVSGSDDQKVRIWRMGEEEPPREIQKQGHALRSLTYSRDGQYVATGGEDRTIRVWEVASGSCVKTLSGHTSWIRAVAFSPDSQILASGGEDHRIVLWRISNGAHYKQLNGHKSWIRALAFSPDGKILASGSDDKTVRLWSVSSGKELQVFGKHTGQVRTVVYSPDGKILASGGEDNIIYLWNPQNEEVHELLGHDAWVRSVAFSPDGKVLISGSDDMTVRMWDVESGECLRVLRGHLDRVRSVACSPLGKIFVSSSDDGTIRVWDVESGNFSKLLRSERPYEEMVISEVRGLTDAQRLNLRALGAIE